MDDRKTSKELDHCEINNGFVPLMQSNLACNKIKLWSFHEKRRENNINDDQESRQWDAKPAHRLFVTREFSQMSSQFIANNGDYNDIERSYDVKDIIIKRSNHHNNDSEEIITCGSRERMQHKVLMNQAVSKPRISCVLPYFANDIDDIGTGMIYDRDNNANNKPRYSSHGFDDVKLSKNKLFQTRFSFVFLWENLGNSSDSWQPCSSPPLAGYKYGRAGFGNHSGCHWPGDNSSVLVCSLDFFKALIALSQAC